MTRRYSIFVGIVLAASACSGGSEPMDSHAEALVAPSCTKDEALVEQIISQVFDPEACATNADCDVCGTHCIGGTCSAECVSTNHPDYGCSDGRVCDFQGACEVPGAEPLVVPSMTVTPLFVEIDEPGSGDDFPTTRFDVVLTSEQQLPASAHPHVRVRGNHSVVLECPGGGSGCPDPSERIVYDLEVKCSEGEAFADDCELDGTWAFTSDGALYRATRSVWARPRRNVEGVSWTLNLSSHGETLADASASLVLRESTASSDGRYAGVLVLRRTTGAEATDAGVDDVATTVPIRGFSNGGELLVVDGARVLSPSGKLRVGQAGESQRFPWLGDVNGQHVAEISVESRSSDPSDRSIRARFRLTLPYDSEGRAEILDADLVLHRDGDIDAAACGAGNACGAGTTCATSLGLCLAGPAFVASTATSPQSGVAYEPMWQWYQWLLSQKFRVGTAWTEERITPYFAERLQCAQGINRSNYIDIDSLLGNSVLSRSGDVRCQALFNQPAASPSAPHGARLLFSSDAGQPRTLEQIMSSCLTELGAGVASGQANLGTSECLSLSRVLPGIATLVSLLEPNRPASHASGVLQHLIRGWISVHAFLAQQVSEDAELASANSAAPIIPLPDLMSRVRAGWALLLDPSVAGALLGLAPRDLRKPDYRWRNRPVMYFPELQSTDVESGMTLTQLGCSNDGTLCDADATPVLDPREIDLSGDLSANFTTAIDAVGANFLSRDLVRSHWLTIRLELEGYLYAKGGRRTGTGSVATASDWASCRLACINKSSCLAWSFHEQDPDGLSNCTLHSATTDQEPSIQTGWVQGVVALGPHQGVPAASFMQHDVNVQYTGQLLAQKSNSTFAKCYLECSSQPWTCKYMSFHAATKVCRTFKPLTHGFLATSGWESATMPAYGISIAHRTERGSVAKVTLPMTAQFLPLFSNFGVWSVVRSNDEKTYRLYKGPDLVGSATFTELPGRGAPGRIHVGRRDAADGSGAPAFEAIKHFALWTTALDRIETVAIEFRYALSLQNGPANFIVPDPRQPASTGQGKNYEQTTELAVTMLEGLSAGLRALERYVDATAPQVYAECLAGASTALRDGVSQKSADLLRHSMLVGGLANDLHLRSQELTCVSDLDCPADATCGDAVRISVDARDAVLTGKMKKCFGFWGANSEGICVPDGSDPNANAGLGSNGSPTPGGVGTATITMTVPRSGQYALWGRAATAMGQSFWIKVDGNPWLYWPIGAVLNDWQWARAGGVFELTGGQHVIRVGVHGDGTTLRELVLTSELSAPPHGLNDVCMRAGEPVRTVPPASDAGELRFRRARDATLAREQRLIDRLAQLDACRNPLGIEEADLPLFHEDPGPGPIARYFAASTYLQFMADQGLSQAESLLSQARNAWISDKQSAFQAELSVLDNERRLEQIARGYNDQLRDLCGTESVDAGGLIVKMASGAADENTCFVTPTPVCLANFARPVREARAECYQGALGEALLAMKASAQDVDANAVSLDMKNGEFQRKQELCAFMQDTVDIVEAHQIASSNLSMEKAFWDDAVTAVALVASLSSGYMTLAAVGKMTEFAPALGSIAGVAGNLMGFGSSGAAERMAEEHRAFEVTMQLRQSQGQLLQCWHDVDTLRDQRLLARQNLIRAGTDFEQATARFGNRRRLVAQLVNEGSATLERERGRSIAVPYHNFWLDEHIDAYRARFARARRLVYLYLRAAEYALQRDLGLRGSVLGARNATELRTVMTAIYDQLADHAVGPFGGEPQNRYVQVSAKQLMGIPSGDQTAFRTFMSSDAAIIRDADGKRLGRGVRFTLAPSSAPESQLITDCAERVVSVTGSVQIAGTVPATVPFALLKRNTFASQRCGASENDGRIPMLVATQRPSRNLFDTASAPLGGFSEVQRLATSTIQAAPNLSLEQMHAPTVVSADFAGRGLYGDYVVLIRDNVLNGLDLSQISDLYLHFNYVGVDNGGSTN